MPVYRLVSIGLLLEAEWRTYGVNRNASYSPLVAPENRLDDSGEGLKLRGRGKLREQRVGVNIEPVLPHTRCQIQVLFV